MERQQRDQRSNATIAYGTRDEEKERNKQKKNNRINE